MSHRAFRYLIAVFFLPFSFSVLAQTPQERGLAIAEAQKARVSNWQDAQSELKMVLRTASGNTTVREIRVKSLEVKDDGDKNLMVFEEPKDVQGTAFLSYSHITGPDDQWIYLPALKRVKRIASRTKSGSFMGSEFSYEDLASFEVAKYDFNYLRDEVCGEHNCHVLEAYPKDDYSGYSKLVFWTEDQDYRIQKVYFYDKKSALLKIMEVKGYQLVDDKHWRPTHSVMSNQQTGNVTELYWQNIRLNTGLTDSDFSQNNLKRSN